MNRILVTGAGGNAGRYLAQRLHADGYDVIGTYRNRKPDCLECELVHINLAKHELAVENVDTIIHVAACLDGDTRQLIEDNIWSTMNLLSYAEKFQVKRFIYMSTVSVYGDVASELNVCSDVINPSEYGCTKYLAEKLVEKSDIPVRLIIGLPRMLGPFVDLKNTKGSGFLTMTKKLLQDEDVICYIPNLLYNNFMHVSDLADFVEKYLGDNSIDGYKKILLGARDRMPMRKILDIMKEASGSKSNIISDDKGIMPHCSLVSIEEAVKMGYDPASSRETLNKFMNDIRFGG